MSNEFPPPGWFLRPESWPYWMSSTSLGLRPLENDPWEPAHSAPLSSAIQPNADEGILAPPTRWAEPMSEDPSAWSLSATPSAANAGILGPLTQPNRPFAESIPSWLQSVPDFDGNAASPVTAALPSAATGTRLIAPATPVTLPDWSTFPIPSPPAPTSLSLPPLGTHDTSDQWLTASYPNLGSSLFPMQRIPDFRMWDRSALPSRPALLSTSPTPQPPENEVGWAQTVLDLGPGLSGMSVWRGLQQSALDPLPVTSSQSRWEASPSTNSSPPPRVANSVAIPETSSIPRLSDADPPTWTPWARYAQNAPRRAASGPGGREPSPAENIQLLLYENAHRILKKMDPGNPELRSMSTSTWIPENRDLNRLNFQIEKLKRGRSSDLERHHVFPLEFEANFRACGINPEDYVMLVARAEHRLRPSGLHTGLDHWNSQWRRFMKEHDRPTPEQFFGQLNMMLKRIPWLQP
jgi:hypothetical protein